MGRLDWLSQDEYRSWQDEEKARERAAQEQEDERKKREAWQRAIAAMQEPRRPFGPLPAGYYPQPASYYQPPEPPEPPAPVEPVEPPQPPYTPPPSLIPPPAVGDTRTMPLVPPQEPPPKPPETERNVPLLPEALGAAGRVNQFLRQQQPGYAGAMDVLTPIWAKELELAGKGMEAYGQQVIGPPAEFLWQEAARAHLPVAGAVPTKAPTYDWQELSRRWQARPDVGGEKFLTEALIDPLNVIGFGEVRQAAKLGLKGAQAVGQTGRKAASEAARVAQRAIPTGEQIRGLGRTLAEERGSVQLTTPREPDWYYSQLRRAIETKMGKSMPVADLRNMLRSPDAAVKPDEMKWTGFDDFLNEKAAKKEPVRKDEALRFLEENNVQVEEVVKGAPVEWTSDGRGGAFNKEGYKIELLPSGEYLLTRSAGAPKLTFPTLEEAKYRADYTRTYQATLGAPYATKFSQYQLPGGESYRELLLTLPGRQDVSILRQREQALQSEWHRLNMEGNYTRRDEIGKELHAVRKQQPEPYRSPHFTEPNVLAHVRFNERRDAAGKKVLFIEEIQSDWHQAGRKEGYKPSPPEISAAEREAQNAQQRWATQGAALKQQIDSLPHPELQSIVRDRDGRVVWQGRADSREELFALHEIPGSRKEYVSVGEPHPDMASLQKKRQQLYVDAIDAAKRLRELKAQTEGISAAPFAKTWSELTFKRILRWAAENNFDSIAWTPGRVHAPERWGTERLAWVKKGDGYVLNVEAQVGGRAGGIDIEAEATARGLIQKGQPVLVRTLEDVKRVLAHTPGLEKPGAAEIAENRTMADKLWERMQALDEGVFKPREEGMKGFYDVMLPSMVEKYVKKKWGGKVGEAQIPTRQALAEPGGRYNVQYMTAPGTRQPAWHVIESATGQSIGGYSTERDAVARLRSLTEPKYEAVHSVDITDSMRTSVLQGQPLFQAIPPIIGGAAGYDPNATPEENAKRMALGAATATGLAYGARRGMMGLSVEDVSHVFANRAARHAQTPELIRAQRAQLQTEDYARLVPLTLDFDPAWSNGFIMDKGVPPRQVSFTQQAVETPGREILKATDDFSAKPAIPLGLGVEPVNQHEIVVFGLPDGQLAFARDAYYAYFMEKYDNPQFVVRGLDDPIEVRVNGNTVGGLMPIKLTDAKPAIMQKYRDFGNEMQLPHVRTELDEARALPPQKGTEGGIIERRPEDVLPKPESATPTEPGAPYHRPLEGVQPEPLQGAPGRGAGATPEIGHGNRAADLQSNRDAREAGLRPDTGVERGHEAGRPPSVSPELATPRPTSIRPSDGGTDFVIQDSDAIGKGGAKTKARQNLDAIQLVRSLITEGRWATPDEQTQLAKYVGWGDSQFEGLFNRRTRSASEWEDERQLLKTLVTDDEYRQIEDSRLNAHYTSPEVIKGIWTGLKRLGIGDLNSVRVLEPSAGAGHFFGLMPPELTARTARTAVELDTLTGNILKQLYQNADVHITGFEKAALPNDGFDLVMGNVPFGKYPVVDSRFADRGVEKALKSRIHNYFFAKAMDKVRPNGIITFITSHGTMDAADSKVVRNWLADRADLVAAYRLPETAFQANAGTSVVTDILFLRKRLPGEESNGVKWSESVSAMIEGRTAPINEYFIDHPDNVLGRHSMQGSMYREDSYTVKPKEGTALADLLDKAMSNLPEGLIRPGETTAAQTVAGLRASRPTGTYVLMTDGKLGRVGANQVVVSTGLDTPSEAKVRSMMSIRDAARKVLEAQQTGASDAEVKALQKHLNSAYDTFVKKHGPLNAVTNQRLMIDDPDSYFLRAMENWTKELEMASKTGVSPELLSKLKMGIFSQRVARSHAPVQKADSAADALVVSLNENGRINWERMSALTGKSDSTLQQELAGKVFRNPEGDWETADQYLSGDVKAKLRTAESAAERDPSFRRHVDALKAVQPPDIPYSKIDVKLGSHWVPPEVVNDFANHILDTRFQQAKLRYVAPTAIWVMEKEPYVDTAIRTSTWGTPRRDATDLLMDALNNRDPIIKDPDVLSGYIINQRATEAARAVIRRMKENFKSWIWQDSNRAANLSALYNRDYNYYRVRDYDGSHLTLPGANALVSPWKHQKDAIWRIIASGTNTLLAHEVGAGKSLTMIAAGMELRRLGLSKKNVYVMPKGLTGQFAAEFQRIYPNSRILLPDATDFETGRRQVFLSKIATGDWDGIILSNEQFGAIKVDPKTEAAFLRKQVDALEAYQEELTAAGTSTRDPSHKDIVRARKTLEAKLEETMARVRSRQDTGLLWEDLGIDQLFVDEADKFKNLFFPTRLRRIKGLPNTASQRSMGLYLKTQGLAKRTNGRGVVFATGTPIANAIAELWTQMRYLMPDTLEKHGLSFFDAWQSQFAEILPSLEQTAAGTFRVVDNRLASYTNIPELSKMFQHVADIVMGDDLKISKAVIAGGKRQIVSVPPTREQVRYMESLIHRMEHMPSDKTQDNHLKLGTDARKAALDMRLIDPTLPPPEDSKIYRLADNISRIYKRDTADKGTQIVFVDLGTPKVATLKEEGEEVSEALVEALTADEQHTMASVYSFIKQELIDRGVLANEIAFVHDARNRPEKLARLYQAVRDGDIRVLIGSTEKLGAGVNVQDRLGGLHHVDTPHRPRDIEQREGRGLRPGNIVYGPPSGQEGTGRGVEIFTYVTERSFDGVMWQGLEAKARFIKSILRRNVTDRTAQEIDEFIPSAAEARAAVAGDKRIFRRIQVESEIARLRIQRDNWIDAQHRARENMAALPGAIEDLQTRVRQNQKDIALRDAAPDTFEITIGKKKYTDRKEAAEALRQMYISTPEPTDRKIGSYKGFQIRFSHMSDASGAPLSHFLMGNPQQEKLAAVSSVMYESTIFNPAEVNPDSWLTRLTNAIDGGIEKQLTDHTKRLQAAERNLATYQKELKNPFTQAALLQKREKEYARLSYELEKGLPPGAEEDIIDETEALRQAAPAQEEPLAPTVVEEPRKAPEAEVPPAEGALLAPVSPIPQETGGVAPPPIEPPKPPAPPAPGGKEPWEMTAVAYEAEQQAKREAAITAWNRTGSKGMPPTGGLPSIGELNSLAERAGYVLPRDAEVVLRKPYHRLQVEAALAEGKPVPPEVLADYPDLAAQTMPAPETAAAPIPPTVGEAALPTAKAIEKAQLAPSAEAPPLQVAQTAPAAPTPPVSELASLSDDALIAQIRQIPPSGRPDSPLWAEYERRGLTQIGQKAKRLPQEVTQKPPVAPEKPVQPKLEAEPSSSLPPPPTAAAPQPPMPGVEPARGAMLPKELAGAKPRYKTQTLNFESDVDKALYIVAHEGVRSKRDADYMAFLQEVFPGRGPGEIRQMGKAIRTAVGRKATGIKGETVDVLHADVGEPPPPRMTAGGAPPKPPKPPTRKAPPPGEPPEALPPVPPEKPGFAGNIRLSKYPEDLRDEITAVYDANPAKFEAARRGVRSDAVVRQDAEALIESVGGNIAKRLQGWQKGQAWNAEEILALREVLANKSKAVVQAQKAVRNSDSTANLASLRLALEEQNGVQQAIAGITAEAGRALRQFRQTLSGAIASGDEKRIKDILDKLGGRETAESLAAGLAKIDLNDQQAVYRFIRQSLKPRFRDYITEIFYNSILSGPRTHIVNSVSNTIALMTSPVERAAAAAIDIPLAAISGRERQRFAKEVVPELFGMAAGLPQGVRKALYILKNGYSWDDVAKLEIRRPQAFKGKPGAVINLPTRALAAADAVFRSINYSAALNAGAYRIARTERLGGDALATRVGELLAEPTPQLLEYAGKLSTYRVFQQKPGAFTQKLIGTRETEMLGVKPLVFAMPFLQTPANLLKFGLERSPLGFLNPNLWRHVAQRSPEAADDIAKAALGSAVAAAVAIYAGQDKITASAPTSQAKRDQFYREGKQPFSIKIGDKWIPYNRFEPFNQPLAQVATIVQAMKNGETTPMEMPWVVAASLSRNLVSQTYMSGIADLIDAVEDPERYGANIMERTTVGLAVPFSAATRTAAQIVDPTIRESRGLPEEIAASIPGLSQRLAPRLNVWGESLRRESPPWLPINVTTETADPVDRELGRFGITVGFVGSSVAGVALTPDEKRFYQELSGRAVKAMLDRTLASATYQEQPDALKAKLLEAVIRKTKDSAGRMMEARLGATRVEEARRSR